MKIEDSPQKDTNISLKIKIACTYLDISESELARRIGTSPQALSQRMKTNKWSGDDLDKIGKALGVEFVLQTRFPDGKII